MFERVFVRGLEDFSPVFCCSQAKSVKFCGLQLAHTFKHPQAHVKLHLQTPFCYSTPAAFAATRLLLRIVEDLLLPEAYTADLAGTRYSLEASETGVKITLNGFTDVLGQLLPRLLTALAGAAAGGSGKVVHCALPMHPSLSCSPFSLCN